MLLEGLRLRFLQVLWLDILIFASRQASCKISALVVIWKENNLMITKNTTILISGASIAGPTLAYWLKRYGFTPTVIERAPQLRAGGYPVDVRFEAVKVAKLMGIWPRLLQEQTTIQEMSFVNERHQRIGRVNLQAVRKSLEALDVDVVEIMRGDLSRSAWSGGPTDEWCCWETSAIARHC